MKLVITIEIPETELKSWHQYDPNNEQQSFDEMRFEVNADFRQFMKREYIKDYELNVTLEP